MFLNFFYPFSRESLVKKEPSWKFLPRQTLAKVRQALRFLCAKDASAKLIMTKDRSSALGEGASRRGRNRGEDVDGAEKERGETSEIHWLRNYKV